MTLLSACALVGRCRAGNAVDYTCYYSVSPYEVQLVYPYRQRLTQ